jgi:phospholipid-translocating ATPase
LRGCNIRNTDWVIGIVVYTGLETKIRLNAGKTPSKRSYNEKLMNRQVVINLIIMFIFCLCTSITGTILAFQNQNASSIWFDYSYPPAALPYTTDAWFFSGFILFWVAVIAFQNLVPISLYLTIEIVKSLQVHFNTFYR